MRNRKLKAPTIMLGLGLSGVPLLPACAFIGSILGGASIVDAEAASAVGFFLALGWLGVCSAIAFVGLIDLCFLGDENEHP